MKTPNSLNNEVFTFGIMSSKYELKCNDLITAKMAMCLFFEKNIPIAIYGKYEQAFRPLEFLESKPKIVNNQVRKAFKSIRKIL